MSRNKKTEILIARIITAVFLFVLISPLSVYAAGESASENESDEEYEDWSDAFNDSDYTDNLAENVASTFASYFQSYVGTRSEVIDEVANYIGDSYDRTVSLYENVYQYVLPYAQTEVVQFDGANLSTSVYGKPVRNKNNLKLINTLQNDLKQSLPTTFVDIAKSKEKTGPIAFDVLPSWIHFEDTCKCPNFQIPTDGKSHISQIWDDGYSTVILDTDGVLVVQFYDNVNGGVIDSVFFPTGSNPVSPYFTRDFHNSWATYTEQGNSFNQNGFYANFVIYGNCYLHRANTDYWYYYDSSKKSLYSLNSAPYGNGFDENNITNTDVYEFNIINSVDFDDYTDLINQLILDVNMENNITNSLLIEILNELKNQRDVYQPTSDDDDIYDYIDYMMNKMLEVKDIHIEIPDLSPNMGGIVDGITALLNFIASIIRTLGSIVSSLLEGLFHLFVPTDADWDEINIQFESLTAPFGWIKEFIVKATSNISLLLFGRNVTDFETAEKEDVDLVMGEGGVDPDIVYDPTTRAPKIPVRFSNSSSEYFSGIEDAYIIDMSWYAPYKPVGDIIVVAFCWLMFIWRVLHDLPGIINGATGAFDQSPQDYSGYLQKEYASWKFFGRK